MSVTKIISQTGTPLKCQRCDHEWLYTGKNRYAATCPHCRTYVTLKKHSILLKDGVSQPAQSVEPISITSKEGASNNG